MLPEANQFYFFIIEAILQIIDRKGQAKNAVKVVSIYDANGKQIKKFNKKDLKKSTKTYTSFITATFCPSYAQSFKIDEKDVWGGEGKVEAHYEDYDQDDWMDEMGSHMGAYHYDPWNKSGDEEGDPKHSTTTYRRNFLVFWPKAFSNDNLGYFKVPLAASSNSVANENEQEAASDPVAKPKTKQKPTDFAAEYAKSGRSGCRLCSQKINKDVLRLALYADIEVTEHLLFGYLDCG